jgi:ribonuclease P protein component
VERLKNPRDFSLVYSQGRPRFGKYVVVSSLPTDLEVSRVGFAVSKKVGNAVTRNRIKRRLRAIIQEVAPNVEPGFDLVIGAKRSCVEVDFAQLRADLFRVLQGSNLLTRTNEGEEHA